MVKSPIIQIGNVKIGGDLTPVVQAMTNTQTSNVAETVAQILELAESGAKIVRITVNDLEAARAVPEIVNKVRKDSDVPIVGDFHFNGNVLLKKVPECAKALDKYRINPGNANDDNFAEMVEIAVKNEKPVRIGVNSGSVDKIVLNEMMAKFAGKKNSDEILVEAMIESVLNSAKLAEDLGLAKNQIVLSAKISDVPNLIKIYENLGKSGYALHLGLTEAGGGDSGVIQSSVALGILLNKGIGNTFRVSITPRQDESRTKEVQVAQDILQSLGLKNFRPKIVSCPGCGRTDSDLFQAMAKEISDEIETRAKNWPKGSENLKIAIMGCVVNGPGESEHADIGISLPGKMEKPIAPVIANGKKLCELKGDDLAGQFMEVLEDYVKTNFT
ncbi:MAG: flavodoxin-dependent (E)-4-hydroxy-3-methylbut-2-enyl-diphosphate synthase [Candidatus Peregrinibacteria bacterium]|nr:flavodoxin-dependent (E)-4-hydroxy-3-methylbut-2-enyl-diphosphate synthase [Candidatus Peregrinibacteria bacterium]